MLAWSIFAHSFRQVFGNLNEALRVSGFLYLLLLVIQYVFTTDFLLDQAKIEAAASDYAPVSDKIILVFLVIATCSIFLTLGLWIMIGWHRNVLLNEKSRFLPAFPSKSILPYSGKLVIMLLILGLGILFSGVLTFLIGDSSMTNGGQFIGSAADDALYGQFRSVAVLLTLFLLLLVSLRISPLLPAAATLNAMTVSEAWKKTEGQQLTFFLLSVIVILSLLFILSVNFFLADSPLLNTAYSFVMGWVFLMVGTSIITTIYSHFVDGRSLDLS